LFDQAPEQAVAVCTEGEFEVGGFVEFVLELAFECVVVGLEEVGLHFNLAYHAVPFYKNTIRISEEK